MLPGHSDPEDPADYITPHSTNLRPGAREEDVDLIWGETDDVRNREWTKLEEDFTNAGYREGITAGKESALQEGFDDGFARVGAPLGREIGVLRGAANAAMGFLSLQTSVAGTDPRELERRKSEVLGVMGGLGRIGLEDLAPPDLEAEEHAREHQRLDARMSSGDVIGSAGAGPNAHDVDALESGKERMKPSGDESLAIRPAVEELNRMRTRLSSILQEIGLDILLV